MHSANIYVYGTDRDFFAVKVSKFMSTDLRYVDAITIIKRSNMTSCSCYYRFFVNICLADLSLMFLSCPNFFCMFHYIFYNDFWKILN